MCPQIGANAGIPSFKIHSQTVSSNDPDTILHPSGENATHCKLPLCPLSGEIVSLHDAASHTWIILYHKLQAMSFPSGEKAIDEAMSLWPRKGATT